METISNQNMPNSNTPKDVFSHLLAIITLYIGVVSVIALLFQCINTLFPDRLDTFYYDPSLEIIRRSAASLIVVWPAHILMSWIIWRDMRAHTEKRGMAIRKWLIYLTIFAAALTIIIDLITLLYNFLGGELTLRFALKVLVVLIVASGIFGYHLFDIRRDDARDSLRPKQLAWLVSALLIVAIGASFFIIGSPAGIRARKFDEQRLQNLQLIQSEITNYWSQKENLPTVLDDLKDSISGFSPPNDPETGKEYEYEPTGPLSFNLCAIFRTKTQERNDDKKISPPAARFYDPYQQNWSHDVGRVCFARSIDPERYGKP